MEAPPVPKICARLRLTLKNPLKGTFVLMGEQPPLFGHPVNEFASRIPADPSCKTNGGVFVGVVPEKA